MSASALLSHLLSHTTTPRHTNKHPHGDLVVKDIELLESRNASNLGRHGRDGVFVGVEALEGFQVAEHVVRKLLQTRGRVCVVGSRAAERGGLAGRCWTDGAT